MADETTTQTATDVKPLGVVASHNGVSVDLVIKPPRRNTKDGDNISFVSGNFEALSDEDLLKFFGMKEVRKRLISTGHTRCKGFYQEACIGPDDALVWDENKSLPDFLRSFEEWSARGETLKELQTQMQDVIDRAAVLFSQGKVEDGRKLIEEDAKELSEAIRSKKRDRSPKAEVA